MNDYFPIYGKKKKKGKDPDNADCQYEVIDRTDKTIRLRKIYSYRGRNQNAYTKSMKSKKFIKEQIFHHRGTQKY